MKHEAPVFRPGRKPPIHSEKAHQRIVFLSIIGEPCHNHLAFIINFNLGDDHPALQLAIPKMIAFQHISVDLDRYFFYIGLKRNALLHCPFQACSSLLADRRSYELMVERPELDARLKSSYILFRMREITTGLPR